MRRGSLKGKNEERQSNMLEKYNKKYLLYIICTHAQEERRLGASYASDERSDQK